MFCSITSQKCQHTNNLMLTFVMPSIHLHETSKIPLDICISILGNAQILLPGFIIILKCTRLTKVKHHGAQSILLSIPLSTKRSISMVM